MTLNFWADRLGRAVQTQVRLYLEGLSDWGLQRMPLHPYLLYVSQL